MPLIPKSGKREPSPFPISKIFWFTMALKYVIIIYTKVFFVDASTVF